MAIAIEVAEFVAEVRWVTTEGSVEAFAEAGKVSRAVEGTAHASTPSARVGREQGFKRTVEMGG